MPVVRRTYHDNRFYNLPSCTQWTRFDHVQHAVTHVTLLTA